MKEYKVTVTKEVTRWHNESNQLHRENGPAEEYANGDKFYYINGLLHRENGPAVERANGYKFYYIKGLLHREDGPAVEYADGSKRYYINGKRLTEQEFKSCENKIVEIEGVKYKLTKV
jgi:hypothetical protein